LTFETRNLKLEIWNLIYEQTAAVFSAKFAFAAKRKALQKIQADNCFDNSRSFITARRSGNRDLLFDSLARFLKKKNKLATNYTNNSDKICVIRG
jgi:hypothetical protein